MALRDQLLGIDSSVYDQLGGKPLMNLSMEGGGPISSFDPFNVPSNAPSSATGGLPNFLGGLMGGTQSPVSQSPEMPAPASPAVNPAPTMSPIASSPAGGTISTPTGSPLPSVRGIASIPPDIRSQLTKADIPELPFNLLTGDISATPQKDMGFVTLHPGAANEWNTPLDFQPSQWVPFSGGESPSFLNTATGYVGPMPEAGFDPGLGNFKSSARNDFLQAGGGPTFDLLQTGRFGNPDTAFMSLKGVQQDVSSPFEVLGSLLGGIGGIAGGFPGFAGLLASKLSGNSLAGLGTRALAGLLG